MKALLIAALAAVWATASPAAAAAESPAHLQPCRLVGVENEVLCGHLRRPLDPGQPTGTQIEIHYAVVPALARNSKPDPVLLFAGGPGQSAIELGGSISRLMARLSNRRELVLIDQRGTGRNAPLGCAEPAPAQPLAQLTDPARMRQRLLDCRVALQMLPHGDLRFYTTTIAMQDVEAVRVALGGHKVNIVGGSYGTRAALEYMRQFPQAVRRAVIDGVAPADMALPASFSPDNQGALDAVFEACAADKGCTSRFPDLRQRWQGLLASLPREATVRHPLTGTAERITVSRDLLLGQVRSPLYSPALASALPLAISEAADGRFDALLGLGSAMTGGRRQSMAEGMHFSVVCSEDMPRLAQSQDKPGADFGAAAADLYRGVCDGWPRGDVPAAFYTLPAAPAATLVLSGGADPVTPPRHGERVARALGAKARHVVVPQAGHGVMSLGCMRDVLFRFIDAESDDDALRVDADCARGIPRPPAFLPIQTSQGN